MVKSTIMHMSLVLFLAGCADGPRFLDVRCNGTPMTETALYFGLSGPAGSLSEDDWQGFRADVLVPAFSEGFTVIDGDGFWRNPETGHAASEPSKVVIRVHERRRRDDQAMTQVIDAYKTRFEQQSVLRVDTRVCAAF